MPRPQTSRFTAVSPPTHPTPPPGARSLVFLVARGDMLGPDQPVVLHLLDIAPMEAKLEVRACGV